MKTIDLIKALVEMEQMNPQGDVNIVYEGKCEECKSDVLDECAELEVIKSRKTSFGRSYEFTRLVLKGS